MTSKDEYPPLLTPGLHKMTMEQLKTLVVDRFPLSGKRGELWNNFSVLLGKIRNLGLRGDVWVDGSFLTEKIDPGDVDFVIDFPNTVLNSLTSEQLELVIKLKNREFRKPECLHSFVMFSTDASDPEYAASMAIHAQWQKDFGFSYVKKEPKGIAVIEVGT